MCAWLLAAVVLLVAARPAAAAAPELVRIGDFTQPVHVASPPNDARVFVVEQDGLVRIAGGGVFLDVTGRTDAGGERGLLSIAFSPDYATSGRVYAYLTTTGTPYEMQVLEFRRSATDASRADPASVRTVWRLAHPLSTSNHNGGQLQFGPDGNLYVSVGDGAADRFAAQDLDSELGKILRIDPRTGAGVAGNVRGRVWASGLRNPWRFSFDRATGDLLIGDVGDNEREEVDWARAPQRGAGADYGWPCFEGGQPGPETGCSGPFTAPAFDRDHPQFCAIVGGYVVRDPGLPTLMGRYLYGDQCLGALRSVALPDTGDHAEPLAIGRVTSLGEDACGRLYAASHAGPVYRIQDGAPAPCSFPPPAGPPMPGADAAAPRLRVKLLRTAVKRRRLRLAVRCDEVCRIVVAARLRGVRRLKPRSFDLRADKRRVVVVKFGRRTARRFRRALRRRGHVRLAVTVRATDAAGNRAVVRRRGRVRRR